MTGPADPRIPPGTRDDVGRLNWVISYAAGRLGGTTTPNLFLTLGRHRRLFRGWLRFASQMMPLGRIPRRETELVILRVAHLRSCAYEFDHHVHLGRRAGVTAADVERVIAGPDATGWSPREVAILQAVDALHHHQDVDDDTWAALRAHLDDRQAIELVMLVGHYEMLATAIVTLRIQPDRQRSRRG